VARFRPDLRRLVPGFADIPASRRRRAMPPIVDQSAKLNAYPVENT
jgi:hypothetical protein